MSVRFEPVHNDNPELLAFRMIHDDGTEGRFLTYRRADDPDGRRAIERKRASLEIGRAHAAAQRSRSFV